MEEKEFRNKKGEEEVFRFDLMRQIFIDRGL